MLPEYIYYVQHIITEYILSAYKNAKQMKEFKETEL